MAIGTNIFANIGGGPAEASAGAHADLSYGPGPSSTPRHPLSPRNGFGLGFWLGVGGVVVLVLIRQSLPR